MAVASERGTQEGIKAACRAFCTAAGYFTYLKDSVLPEISGPVPSDLSADGLNMAINLMLAQAQACFYESAVKNSSKPSIVAMLGASCAFLYHCAFSHARSSTMNGTLDRNWGAHMMFQVGCFEGASQYWQSAAVLAKAGDIGVGYGEELVRLDTAAAVLRDALKQGSRYLGPELVETARQLEGLVSRRLAKASADNDTIYLEARPAASTLAEIKRVRMVKVAMPDESEGDEGEDLLDGLVPVAVYEAASRYSERVSAIMREAREETERHSAFAKGKLAAVGLPAAIEAQQAGPGLPDAVWRRIDRVQRDGALDGLRRALARNEAEAAAISGMLAEARAALEEEEKTDSECRARYGARWTRAPSNTLNRHMLADISRYLGLLREAAGTDADVKAKLDAALPRLAALAQSRSALEAAMPSRGEASVNPHTAPLSALLVQLGELLTKGDELLEALVTTMKEDNILPVLLRNEESKEDALFASQLEKFEPLRAQMRDNAAAQAPLLAEIMEKNDAFRRAAEVDAITRAREQQLQLLQTAINDYDTLSSNLGEGATFYADLRKRCERLRDTCNDHVFSRGVERKDALLAFQQGHAGAPAASAAAAAYPAASAPPAAAVGGGAGAAGGAYPYAAAPHAAVAPAPAYPGYPAASPYAAPPAASYASATAAPAVPVYGAVAAEPPPAYPGGPVTYSHAPGAARAAGYRPYAPPADAKLQNLIAMGFARDKAAAALAASKGDESAAIERLLAGS
eukprot:PLAT12543.15.p1 GENE.PLAT12543.15~~PLAT12543.15.p1  ORF type:complete len:746 (-),score=421.35 PLAT12543.15:63-2300(-)